MEHKRFTELASGANTTLTFNWDTTEVTSCFNYAIWAEASVLPDEVDTADNTFIGGKVGVKMLGG